MLIVGASSLREAVRTDSVLCVKQVADMHIGNTSGIQVVTATISGLGQRVSRTAQVPGGRRRSHFR
jgi:hypothetical protein